MGFYLRKSISLGPLRFNLSKAGIGLSTGIKGLRLGMGPRGNYVHMGRHGIYYRATLPREGRNRAARPTEVSAAPPTPTGTHGPLQAIESAEAYTIVDSSSRELLQEFNRKRKRLRLWPLTFAISVVIAVSGVASGWPNWGLGVAVVLGVAAVMLVYQRDLVAKTVILFYEMDSEMEKVYGALHQCGEFLAACHKAWHIESEGKVHERKYHAGASNLVKRKETSINKAPPPHVRTNVVGLPGFCGHPI